MARRPRDYAAEYQRRQAKLRAEGTSVFKQRDRNARRLGYDSLRDQTARRKAGEPTPLDTAANARIAGRHVTDLGGDRWTWAGDPHLARGPLNATFGRAIRKDLEMRVNLTARWADGSRKGTATASYIDPEDVMDIGGEDALDGVYGVLSAVTVSNLPPGATITDLSCFFYPLGESEAA